MIATIIIVLILAIWFGLGVRSIINNIKNGKGIDGCNMDCSRCNSSCHGNWDF